MLAGVASAAGRAAIHAVRVQIIPAPRSLADSREILRILQSYGEVTTYRWLKHDALSSAPNSAMAIFSEGEAMNRFLQDCPLTFEIDRTEREEVVFDELPDEDTEFSEPTVEPANSNLVGDELVRTENALTDSAPSLPVTPKQTSKPATYHTRPQLFRVKADVWRGKHRDWLERHPFWGNFQPNKRSIIQQDLGKRVPLIGLSDIDVSDKREIPIRVLNRRKEETSRRPTLRDMIRELRGEAEERQRAGERATGHWG